MHHKQSREADKKAGTHHQRREQAREPALVGTMKHYHGRHTQPHTHTPLSKNILGFRPLLSPIFPRKHQAPPKIYSLLPLFTENLPRWSRKGSRKGEAGEQPGSIQKGTPPPSRGAARAFSPHNFSRHKSRKKFAPKDWLM